MKLISLNTWGGVVYEPLMEFIKLHSAHTDIFCFQEILKDGNGKTTRNETKSLYEDISQELPNHKGYFFEYQDGGYFGESSKSLDFKFGIACFVRSNLKQNFIQGINLRDLDKKWGDYDGRFAVGTALGIEVEDYAIINVHGLWQGSIKKDTEAKIEQSEKIINLTEKTKGKKIICGDFNLLPDTESILKLDARYQNLIKKYGILSTRSVLYTKELRHSDYLFVDEKIKVNDFSIPDLVMSDHLPLLLDCE